jgi:hypothetical protein
MKLRVSNRVQRNVKCVYLFLSTVERVPIYNNVSGSPCRLTANTSDRPFKNTPPSLRTYVRAQPANTLQLTAARHACFDLDSPTTAQRPNHNRR